MKEQTQETRTRNYWLRWLGWCTRDHESNEIDFMQLLAPEYGGWGAKVLGYTRPHWPYGPTPKDYLRKAVLIASLPQLLELYAIRYIEQHPVPDGVAYTGNCHRAPVVSITARRVAKPAASPTL